MTGHGNVTARETFSARIEVLAYCRPAWLAWTSRCWKLVERRVFENAAFELGGSYRNNDMLRLDSALHHRKSVQNGSAVRHEKRV